jgi:hypothetical protein
MIGFILSLISPNTHDGKCPSLWDSSFIFGGIYQQRKAAELLYQRLIVTLFLFFKHIIILKKLTQGYVKTKTQAPYDEAQVTTYRLRFLDHEINKNRVANQTLHKHPKIAKPFSK